MLRTERIDQGALNVDTVDDPEEVAKMDEMKLACEKKVCVNFVQIQLIRIERRVPEYGWTTQKVFHFMNFIVNGARAVSFGFHKLVFLLHPKAFTLVLLDLPGILFFSTYTLLVLFWAEIYHQARSLPTDKLRVFYISSNCAIYFIQHISNPPNGFSILRVGMIADFGLRQKA
ncbi:tobamovirus multiplication protein 1-like [Henckelia pumila]|uniref:tobamovirus multiplication protein 1-like n=1 Tax=Henckelia pumila TaxID=405737 RepID=UPI003C6DD5F7